MAVESSRAYGKGGKMGLVGRRDVFLQTFAKVLKGE